MTQHLRAIVWSLVSQSRNGPLLHWFPLIKTEREKVGQSRHFRATVKRRIIVSKITSKLVFIFSLRQPQKYITALCISCVPGLELASLRTPDSPGAPSSENPPLCGQSMGHFVEPISWVHYGSSTEGMSTSPLESISDAIRWQNVSGVALGHRAPRLWPAEPPSGSNKCFSIQDTKKLSSPDADMCFASHNKTHVEHEPK